jgi:heavy metal translocating P-type ATPase
MQNQVRDYRIDGMSCGACVAHVERVVGRLEGVNQVSVNLATAQAQIKTAADFDEAGMLALLAKHGYPAQPIQPEDAAETLRKKQDEDEHHIQIVWRKFLIAAILTLPIFVVEMGGHLIPPFHHYLQETFDKSLWVAQAILALMVIIFPGREFFTKGFSALFAGNPDMNSLVALGSGAAVIYSLVVTFAPSLMATSTSSIALSVYYEAACVIITLVLLGRYWESRARSHTGDAIIKLMQLQPHTAHSLVNGEVVDVDAQKLALDDLILIKPGERIPADARVVSGYSSCDQSAMTGESVPVEKQEGDLIIGGTLNLSGALTAQVTRAIHDGLLAKIVQAVANAQSGKLPIQALADKVTYYFVPSILLIALVTFAGWYFIDGNMSNAVVHSVAVLIVACPCAMGLATPTAIMVATGRAAELGILYRDGASLQRLADVNAIAFDKTGTLTKGKLELIRQISLNETPENTLLRWAASAEQASEHPIAQALLNSAKLQELELIATDTFNVHPGGGVAAKIAGEDVLLGNKRFIETQAPSLNWQKLAAHEAQLSQLNQQGYSYLYMTQAGQLAAIFAFADTVKDDSPSGINHLKNAGVHTLMITGDNPHTANAIASQLGIHSVHAEVLPTDKAHLIDELKKSYGAVGFVGDGINDAPALATADVGIAMGTGTDIAMDSADIVLVKGSISGVATAFTLSRKSLRTIKQNLFWAFAYNVLLIPVATGLFSPWGLHLSPMMAAAAMAASSLLVVTNSLRLRFWHP